MPVDFGTVERIARCCGATPEQRDRLYAAWTREAAKEAARESAREAARAGDVDGAAQPPAPDTAPPDRRRDTSPPTEHPDRLPYSDAPVAPRAPDAAEPQSRPRPASDAAAPARMRWSHRLFIPLLAVVCVVVGVSPTERLPVDTGAGPRSGAPGQHYVGPAWALTPSRLDREFFGMTMNTDTGRMPDFRVGGVRLWESETRWGQLEPEPDRFTWTVLERAVDEAERDGLPVLFTFGGTPRWAAPEGDQTPYADGTRSAPPDDLADWDRFVEKVVTRYRGRIDAYELWDNVGATSHYSGDMRTLAEMVRRAARIIRRVDRDAQVACPSFSRLWKSEGRALLRKFARAGAYKYCDAAAVKLHPRRADGPPEEIIELAERVQEILYDEDEGSRLWNTGPGKDIVTAPPLSARQARDYAVRFYLVAMYARRQKIDRMYFYAWGSTTAPLVVQPVDGRPTEAGRRIGRLQDWIADTDIASCGFGASARLPHGVYECWFRSGDSDPRSPGHWLAVRWTRDGAAPAEARGAHRLRRMDGSTERLRPGDRIEYGESPVLVEYRPGVERPGTP